MSEKARLDIAAICKAIRKQNGWSETELAERAGVGRTAIREIESASGNPTLGTLDKVGGALGVDLY